MKNLLLALAMFVCVLSLNTAFCEEKTHPDKKEEPKVHNQEKKQTDSEALVQNSKYENVDFEKMEKKLLKDYKADKDNKENVYALADFYFWNAVKYDMLNQWGDKSKKDEREKLVKKYSLAAIKYFKKYIHMDEKNATAWARLAQSLGIRMRNGGFFVILKHLGYFNKSLKRALEVNPDEFEALITKAYKTLYTPSFIKNRKKMAKEQFEKLLKEHPKNPHVTKGMAITFQRMKDFDKALKYIDLTLEYAPDDLEAIGLKKQILAKIDKEEGRL